MQLIANFASVCLLHLYWLFRNWGATEIRLGDNYSRLVWSSVKECELIAWRHDELFSNSRCSKGTLRNVASLWKEVANDSADIYLQNLAPLVVVQWASARRSVNPTCRSLPSPTEKVKGVRCFSFYFFCRSGICPLPRRPRLTQWLWEWWHSQQRSCRICIRMVLFAKKFRSSGSTSANSPDWFTGIWALVIDPLHTVLLLHVTLAEISLIWMRYCRDMDSETIQTAQKIHRDISRHIWRPVAPKPTKTPQGRIGGRPVPIASP